MSAELGDRQAIADALRSCGWHFVEITAGVWKALLCTTHHQRGHALYAWLDPEGFLVLAVTPFLRGRDCEDAERLYARLMTLNHELWLAKFSIDDDLDVVLSAECALGANMDTRIGEALSAIAYYAELYYGELMQLCGTPPPRIF